ESAAIEKLNARLPEVIKKLDTGGPEAQVVRNALGTVPVRETVVVAEEFPIIGVIRKLTVDERNEPWDQFRVDSDAMLLIPSQTRAELYLRGPSRSKAAVNRAVAIVGSEAHVKEVVRRVKALGLDAQAAIEFIDRQRLLNLLIFGGMTCVAAVALMVSALGITNTM